MSSLVLRPYQEEAVSETFNFLNKTDKHGLIVLPTGAGKTPVGSTITQRVVKHGRVLIVSHVKELLEQTYNTFSKFMPDLVEQDRVGLYSAGLKRRDMHNDVIIAGIQSVYDKINLFGAFKLLIIDEAHLIPKADSSMYQTLIKVLLIMNPDMRIIGLTATPYRLTTGLIYGDGEMFDEVIYEVSPRRLINEGYLSPLVGHQGVVPNLSGVHIRGGDFKNDELAERCDEIIIDAVEDLIASTNERHHILTFCVTVAHAEKVAQMLCVNGMHSRVVHGKTPPREREMLISAFKAGTIRNLVNVGVLTTGFDATMIDCVVMMRPTQSPGLYSQILGRGLRIHPGKKNCLVLDFAGNISRHGPIDEITPPKPVTSRPAKDTDEEEETGGKICPECSEILKVTDRICYVCDYEFPVKEVKHDTKADRNAQPLSQTVIEHRGITGFDISTWKKTGVEAKYAHRHPDTVRIDYYMDHSRVSEWKCPGHAQSSYKARREAERWWSKLMPGSECPETAQACVDRIKSELVKPDSISIVNVPISMKVNTGSKWPELIELYYEEKKKTMPCHGCRFFSSTNMCQKSNEIVPRTMQDIGCMNFAEIPF